MGRVKSASSALFKIAKTFYKPELNKRVGQIKRELKELKLILNPGKDPIGPPDSEDDKSLLEKLKKNECHFKILLKRHF